jgi:CheY-like chemotaxis protein
MLLKHKRIFLVEDNQSNATIIQMLLEQEGARVLRGRWGGPDTIQLFKKALPIDLIVMDLMLPNGITGYDVYDDLVRCGDADGIPVVAVSAGEPAIAIPKTRDKGFSGFIAKPVDFTHFPNQIADILMGTPVWSTGRIMED